MSKFTCALLLSACGDPNSNGVGTHASASSNAEASSAANTSSNATSSTTVNTSSGSGANRSDHTSAQGASSSSRSNSDNDATSSNATTSSDSDNDTTSEPTSESGTSTSGTADAAVGAVQIGRRFTTTSSSVEASARFRAEGAVTTSDCVRETIDTCLIETCTPNDKTATPAAHAGDITISDGALINLTLTTPPGEDYWLQSGPDVDLVGGEVLNVAAAGADVPAFTTEIAVPLVITVSAPALDDMGVGNIPASGDLVLSFDNRAADGETNTELYILGQNGDGVTLACFLPTATGTATLAAAALDRVREPGVRLTVLTTRTKHVQAGPFAVNVFAYLSAMNDAKTRPVSLQF